MTLECKDTKLLHVSGCLPMSLPWRVEPTTKTAAAVAATNQELQRGRECGGIRWVILVPSWGVLTQAKGAFMNKLLVA
jgi:hypothetical protein